MTAVTRAYDSLVEATALRAGRETFAVCLIAEESGRFAASLGTHSLAVAPCLTEIAQASHALAGLLLAVRIQHAFGIPIGRETLTAIVGTRNLLQNACTRLRAADDRVVHSLECLDDSTTALLGCLADPSANPPTGPFVGASEPLTNRLLLPAAADRTERASVGLELVEAVYDILEGARPFINDWIATRTTQDGAAIGNALQAFLDAAEGLSREQSAEVADESSSTVSP
jgi:hypothetical protein